MISATNALKQLQEGNRRFVADEIDNESLAGRTDQAVAHLLRSVRLGFEEDGLMAEDPDLEGPPAP